MLENQTAPAWILQENMPALDDFRGRPTLLLFFNLGCDGCMFRAVPAAREVVKQFPEVQMVGIHSTFGAFAHTTGQIQQELESLHLPFPVVLDDGHATYDAYHAEGTPHWIYIDADGVVQRSIFGSQPNALTRLDYLLLEQFGE